MGILSALFFAGIQSAEFYQSVHDEAVSLLPQGECRTWWDVGCGPGLVTRLAGDRGYRATGYDADPAMVYRARAVAHARTDIKFEVATLEQLAGSSMKADIVSATSLLAVLPDRAASLRQLLACVAPGGTLLLVEPDKSMTRDSARSWRAGRTIGRGAFFLDLWAATRNPARAIGASTLDIAGWNRARHPLMGGLVNAWTMRRA